MLIRKQLWLSDLSIYTLLKQIKDHEVADYNPANRISQTLQYKNSESIQEEEEHSSFSQMCYLKPVFAQTCPQQPIDISSCEDNKVPTITYIPSHKSFEQLHQNSDSKKQLQVPIDSSLLSSSSHFQSQLLSDHNKKLTFDQGRVKIMVNQIKQKLLNSIHYSKYNDPLITQEQRDISSQRYYYFTMYYMNKNQIPNSLNFSYYIYITSIVLNKIVESRKSQNYQLKQCSLQSVFLIQFMLSSISSLIWETIKQLNIKYQLKSIIS